MDLLNSLPLSSKHKNKLAKIAGLVPDKHKVKLGHGQKPYGQEPQGYSGYNPAGYPTSYPNHSLNQACHSTQQPPAGYPQPHSYTPAPQTTLQQTPPPGYPSSQQSFHESTAGYTVPYYNAPSNYPPPPHSAYPPAPHATYPPHLPPGHSNPPAGYSAVAGMGTAAASMAYAHMHPHKPGKPQKPHKPLKPHKPGKHGKLGAGAALAAGLLGGALVADAVGDAAEAAFDPGFEFDCDF